MRSSGFTLIENLIALLALAVVATTLLSVHLNTLRAEKAVREIQASGRVAETVVARQVFGLPAAALEGAVPTDYLVESEPWIPEGGSGRGPTWERWTVAPSNRPGWGIRFDLPSSGASTAGVSSGAIR